MCELENLKFEKFEELICGKGCCKLNFTKLIHKFKPDLKTNKTMTKRESAGVAILKKEKENINKILLTQSYNNMWGVPKGKQERGETLIECACREVLEEAGISISLESLKGSSVLKYTPVYDKNLTIHIFVYNMTDMDMITWNLENIRMDNLHFDSTGLGWANINCLLNKNENKPKLNALTRFVTKQLSKKQV